MSSEIVTFGVSLGNSTCCIAVNRNSNIDVVANASGERVTPAVTTFLESEVVTGTAAKQALVRHDRCSVTGALRAIDSKANDDLVFPLNLKCHLSHDTKKPKFVLVDGERNQHVTPEEALRHIFTLLKDIASSHSKDEKLAVVIAVPAWISSGMTSSVYNIANASGFHVIKTISQPSASCLAYDLLNDNKDSMNVLIFHCGGTSIVSSVGEIAGGLLSIKETSYSLTASGDAITNVLVDHFGKEFFSKYRGDPLENRRSRRKLFTVSENSKHVLSTMSSAQVYAESLWEGVDFSTQLSRGRFEGLISPLLNEFLAPAREVLQRTNLSFDKIDKVVLSGGTCKIPKLQNVISETFKNAEILKKFPADEILAIGAAKEASFYISGKKSNVQSSLCLLPCLSAPVYIKIQEKKESQCIFTSGTPSHSHQSLLLECPKGSSSLLIYEAMEASEFPSEDQILAQIELNFMDVSTPVNLQVESHLKNDGSMVVKMVEPLSKLNKSFIIEAGQS
ncbi:UNVERIFIED_CONTAM: hypothetical protein RMT77_008465 [Armadillidium vulgare]